MDLEVAGSSPVSHPSSKRFAESVLRLPAGGRQCTIDGRNHYLGRFDSPESKSLYTEKILASQRNCSVTQTSDAASSYTVGVEQYWPVQCGIYLKFAAGIHFVKPASYDRLAQLYNVHLSRFSQRTLPVLERLVLSRLPARARILDVCCGTGQLAAMLGQRGYEVTGIDESEEMLHIARGNAPSSTFIVADARTFESAHSFDAAFSTHDSMNHMLSVRDLRSAFTRVHDVLLGGGFFAFDLNMESVFLSRWNGCLRAESHDELCEIVASWDANTRCGCNQARFFCRDGKRTAQIIIVEKCFSETEVRDALEQAGFGAVAAYDAQIELGMEGEFGRTFFVAERR